MFTTAYRSTPDPLAMLHAALWGFLACLASLLAYWRPLALAALCVVGVGLCVACPLLPLGLAITAVVGWVTYPRAGRGQEAVQRCN